MIFKERYWPRLKPEEVNCGQMSSEQDPHLEFILKGDNDVKPILERACLLQYIKTKLEDNNTVHQCEWKRAAIEEILQSEDYSTFSTISDTLCPMFVEKILEEEKKPHNRKFMDDLYKSTMLGHRRGYTKVNNIQEYHYSYLFLDVYGLLAFLH